VPFHRLIEREEEASIATSWVHPFQIVGQVVTGLRLVGTIFERAPSDGHTIEAGTGQPPDVGVTDLWVSRS
jgi:hypothetical protein